MSVASDLVSELSRYAGVTMVGSLMKAFALDTALLEGIYESIVGDMATSHVAELPNRKACIIKPHRLSCCDFNFLPKACKSMLVRVLCSFCLHHVCTVVCAMTAKALGQEKQECLYLSGGPAKFAPMPRHQSCL